MHDTSNIKPAFQLSPLLSYQYFSLLFLWIGTYTGCSCSVRLISFR